MRAAKSARQVGTKRPEKTRHKMSISHNIPEIKEKKRKSLKATLPLPEVRAKRSGENAPNVKLTWKLVNDIREKYTSNNVTVTELAREYCNFVSYSTISAIINNRLWKK